MKPAKVHFKLTFILLCFLLLVTVAAGTVTAFAYSPQKGDSFNYSETITVNNGQGSYSGYTDQTTTTGTEQVTSVIGSNVSAHYSYTYSFSNSQSSTTSGSFSGDFTWSTNTYTYVKGNDNQLGYTPPIYIWFAVNPSLGVNQNFTVLNTQFVILSKNYSLLLPTEGRYVQTIAAEGTGQFQRNDAYGVFSGPYTWYEYFDPVTGYIVAYNYVEQDTGSYNGQSGSFTYAATLYVTSTSYSLGSANPPTSTIGITTATTVENIYTGPTFIGLVVLLLIIVLVVVLIAVSVAKRRRRQPLPQHPYPPSAPPPPPSTPWESKVDLGSKPSEQVVIRDVAKVACKYCGTLFSTTADHCPYCGAPRQ